MTLFTNPLAAVGAFAAGVAPVAVLGLKFLPVAIVWWAWVLYPFVFPKAYAGLGTMRRTVQEPGPGAEPTAFAKL